MIITTEKKLQLEGSYKLNDNLLQNGINILKVGIRHRPKKGQAKRFIGYIDHNKPDDESYVYISSLYSVQGTKNSYRLDYDKQEYILNMSGLNLVTISKTEKEKALVFMK